MEDTARRKRLGVLVKRKKLVKNQEGKWVEAWVDEGPTRPNTMTSHRGAVNRRLDGKRASGRQT